MLQVGPWVLGRHRQAPVLGSQPCPRAPPTSHWQPAAGGSKSMWPAPVGPPAPPAPAQPRCSTHPPPRAAALRDRLTSPRGCLGPWTTEALSPGARALGSVSDACRQGKGLEGGSTEGRNLPPRSHARHGSGRHLEAARQVPRHARALAGPLPPLPLLGLSIPQDGVRGPRKRPLTTAAEVVSLVQPEEAVLAGRAGVAAYMGLAEALAVALGAEGEGGTRQGRVPTRGSHGPQYLGPQTHRLALSNSTQCAPGVTAAAWGRGRVGLRAEQGAGGPELHPRPSSVEPALPHPRGLPQHSDTHSGQTHGCSPQGC